MWRDLEAVPLIKPTQAMQPDTITRKLKSFQLEGLDWMMKQEKSQWKGGLLGDEMGMGKTIQAVSLIMSDYPAKSPTLVVVVSFRRYCSCTAPVLFSVLLSLFSLISTQRLPSILLSPPYDCHYLLRSCLVHHSVI